MDDHPHADPAPATPEAHDPIIDRFERGLTAGQGARDGAKWLASSRLFIQLAQFTFGIINARLLVPEEFGLAAIPLALIALAEVFTDIGLSAAVVRAKVATTRLLNTAFFLNLVAGLLVAVIVAAIAQPLANFYGDQDLFHLLLYVAAGFAFTRGSVQTAVLERTYQYKRLATVETSAFLIGAITTPVLAVAGLGAEAIVIGALTVIVLRSVFLWIAVGWRPSQRPDRAEAAELWRYSRGLVGFNILNFWASRNVDTLVLGRAASAADLGEYNRAYNLMMVPVRQTSQVLGRVLFPSLARLADEPARVADAWIRGASAAAFVTMPVAVTMAVTAPASVIVLYGDNWAGMSPVLTLLALGALPQTLSASTGAVYRAIDRTGQLFRRGAITTALTIIAVFVGVNWGTHGVAAALIVNAVLGLLVMAWPLLKALDITPAMLRPLVPAVTVSATMAAAELAVAYALPGSASPFLVLPLQAIAGGIAFFALGLRIKHSIVQAIARRLPVLRRWA